MMTSAGIFELTFFRPVENIRRMRGLVFILVISLHFAVMVWLLNSPHPQPKKPNVIEVVMLTPEPVKLEPVKEPPPAPVVKQEPIKPVVKPKPIVKPPEPVKKVTPPKLKPVAQPKVLTTVAENAEVSIPKFETAPVSEFTPPSPPVVAKAVTKSVETSGLGQDDNKVTSGVVPIVRVPPKYPPRAASRHIEGWVKVEFTITTEGEVSDAAVINAEPPEIFDEAALNAIAKWEFKAKIVNGVAVKQRAVQTLQFKLEN